MNNELDIKKLDIEWNKCERQIKKALKKSDFEERNYFLGMQTAISDFRNGVYLKSKNKGI